MTTTEAEAAFPWLQGYWDTFGRFFARPPGGESLAEVATRVYLFLGMLFRDRPQQRILVVSHAGTLRVFRYRSNDGATTSSSSDGNRSIFRTAPLRAMHSTLPSNDCSCAHSTLCTGKVSVGNVFAATRRMSEGARVMKRIPT